MKKAKKFAVLFLAVTMMGTLASCSQSSGSSSEASSNASSSGSSAASSTESVTTITDGTLTMSTNAEFEPFEYRDNGEIAGIDVDIAKKIAEKLGLQLKINDVDFTSLSMELETNKCDFVAAGWTIDPDREKNVDFSDVYYDASQAIIVKKDSAIKVPTDLDGKTVGVQQGTTGDTYCTNEDGSSQVNVGTVKRYNKGSDAVLDLTNGRIDAIVIDNFPATKFVENNPDKIKKLDDALTSEQYAIGVKKGNSALLKVINSVLAEIKSDGELDQIVSKYTQE